MTTRRAPPVWLALTLGTVGLSTPAHGQDATGWQLDWSAPSDCPDAAAVRQSVTRLLGSTQTRGDAFSARASVTRTRSGWHAEIDTVHAAVSGSRSLDAERCEELADATALIVALMIDPDAPGLTATTRAASPTPSTALPTSPAGIGVPATSRVTPTAPLATTPPGDLSAGGRAASTTPASGDRASGTAARRNAPWFAAAEVAAGLGTLPGLSAGIGLAFGYRRDRFRFVIDGLYWPAETATVNDHAPAGGSVDLEAGSASVCFAFARTARFDTGPCATFEAGRMHATAKNVPTSSAGAAFWAAAAAGGYASLRIVGPLAASVDVRVLVPLASPDFELAHVGSAFQPAQVEARTAFSGELRF